MRTILSIATILGTCSAPAQGMAQPPARSAAAEAYIQQWKDVAMEKMKQHGIPASITLAQGLLESRNGQSVLAIEGNNHFGIKCTPEWTGGRMYHDDDRKDDCFRKYRRAEESFEDHSRFLQRPRYAALFTLEPTDHKGWAHGLKKAGYATDPRYPHKLIELIARYELDKFDRGIDVQYARRDPAVPGPGAAPRNRGRGRTVHGDRTVTIGGGREVYTLDGRVKFVRAKAGETIIRIAGELELLPGWIATWNDLPKDQPLQEGQTVFIQPKRNKSRSPEHHTAEAGETLWGISQRYGVKLKKLAQYNGMGIADPVQPGQRVWLRKPRD